MASHFPPHDDPRAGALTLVTARAFFCNGNLGEALLGGVGGVEGCAPGTAVSNRHPLGRYQRRLSASLYGRGCTSPRPAFCLLQSKTAHPWVFTKGTGHLPKVARALFLPLQRPQFQQGAQFGGRRCWGVSVAVFHSFRAATGALFRPRWNAAVALACPPRAPRTAAFHLFHREPSR